MSHLGSPLPTAKIGQKKYLVPDPKTLLYGFKGIDVDKHPGIFFFARPKALKPLAQKKGAGLLYSEALEALKPPSQVEAG